MRIPISTKIIFLTIFLLILATAMIAKQSSEFFQKVMIQREDYSNMSEANSRAKEVENILTSAQERAEIVANLVFAGWKRKMETGALPAGPDTNIEVNFRKDQNLVSIEIWRVSGGPIELLERKSKDNFSKDVPFPAAFFEDLRKKIPFPLKSMISERKREVINSTFSEKWPLFTIGFPIAQENGIVTHVALADYQLSLIQKPFSGESERMYYLVDRNGFAVAHQDESRALRREDFRSMPLIEKALSDSSPRRQTRFQDPETDQTYIGAFVKSPAWGTIVVAQTSEQIILEPAREVQRKAYYVSGIVISIALFMVFLFSMTLTSPIEKLAELIKVVAKGNFDVKARLIVKTKDEVGDLAIAFDNMTDGLKERDKVKNLFSKFHGSSVAEDLIKNDIAVGGTTKNVTVFFSDIRGFTKFSEGKTPEEVVTMLNEYFAIMVKIINANGGVVDKFIGDAIMAVWGAPHSSARDTHNAVKACLEMRQALEKLNNTRRNRGQTDIMIGMGLHTGDAISGTIGSEERMEYTVIGDTVNMTSRIESSTKAFGSDLLVSDIVANKVDSEFWLEYAGSAEVKGKSEPLKFFKVRGLKNANGSTTEIKTEFSDYQAEDAEKVKLVS